MSKKELVLPSRYTKIIKERLDGRYSESLIKKVRSGQRVNISVYKELLKLSQEFQAEMSHLRELEASVINQ